MVLKLALDSELCAQPHVEGLLESDFRMDQHGRHVGFF
jgi:hypothetical protein